MQDAQFTPVLFNNKDILLLLGALAAAAWRVGAAWPRAYYPRWRLTNAALRYAMSAGTERALSDPDPDIRGALFHIGVGAALTTIFDPWRPERGFCGDGFGLCVAAADPVEDMAGILDACRLLEEEFCKTDTGRKHVHVYGVVRDLTAALMAVTPHPMELALAFDRAGFGGGGSGSPMVARALDSGFCGRWSFLRRSWVAAVHRGTSFRESRVYSDGDGNARTRSAQRRKMQ